MIVKVLTIAGSDPSGGAGIQGDLKTFAALGAYGMSAIAALTAQNTLGVQGVHAVAPRFLALQLKSVLSDIPPDAVKTGMLLSTAAVETVAEALRAIAARIPLVVDPVMAAKSGDRLLRPSAVRAMVERLFPLASIVTPNAAEAALLTRVSSVSGKAAMEQAAAVLLDMGPKAVLLKGGHAEGPQCDDLFADRGGMTWLKGKRLDQRHTHGTGCALSAALAVFLARRQAPLEACRNAKRFISGAIKNAFPVGGGIGPVNHLWRRGRS